MEHPDYAGAGLLSLIASLVEARGGRAGEPRHLHIGYHGGASAEEMMIPLVVATT